MMMKRYFEIIIGVLVCLLASMDGLGQCPNGDKAYSLLQYSRAINEYEKCISKKENSPFVLEKLGDCYMILDNVNKAEDIFRQAIAKNKTYNGVLLKYAQALYINGKTQQYKAYLDSLLTKYPRQKDLQRMNNAMVYEDHSKYFVTKPISLNTAEADFAPVMYHDKLVFSSSRPSNKKSDLFTGQTYSELYIGDPNDKEAYPFLPKFALKYNVGTCAFYDTDKKMMFTANSKSKNVQDQYLLKIYTTADNDGQWSEPKEFEYNHNKYNTAHPSISPSGKLLIFSSDRYGQTGMDLYQCFKTIDGKWKPPVRLKTHINTSGNEVFPTFLNDSTLVYSSDGVGKGLDMYQTILRNGKWTQPVILPAPFNSSADDYALYSDDQMKSGYFTSNRQQTDGSEDIYYFEAIYPDTLWKEPKPEIATLKETLQFDLKTITESSKPIADALIVVIDLAGDTIAMQKSNADGKCTLSLPKATSLRYQVSKEGYFIVTEDLYSSERLVDHAIDITLKPLKKDAVFALENIYYEYDKSDILPESAVELDQLFQIMQQHPAMVIELSSHTDARGNDHYNLKLSEQRAKSAAEYLYNLGIRPYRIQSKGYGETKIINHCLNGVTCTDEEHRQNRRTEVKVIRM